MRVLGASVAALAFISLPLGQGATQTLPPAVVAVIDTELLLRESAAGKNVLAQVGEIRAKYQAEISRREDALRVEEEALRRQQTILSPEAFAEKRREFQGKVAALQRYVQDTTKMVDESIGKAMGEVQRTVFKILEELSSEHGFNLVLDKAQLRFGYSELELTGKVLKRLDERLPAVAVQLPGAQQ